jgi:hypothetical protein
MAVGLCDKRSKTEQKRRENGGPSRRRRLQPGSWVAVGMAKIDEGFVGHE